MSLKILHISDTHGMHSKIPISLDVDVVIHSGDCSNHKVPALNVHEVHNFLEWYAKVPVVHKIFVAGNHDTSIQSRLITREMFLDRGITYLEHEEITINGVKIFGSPYTPTFGDWAFMKARAKMHAVWESMPPDIDVLVTHGPPKGVRDLTLDRDGSLLQVGDLSLAKWVSKHQPKLHLFGHIHDCRGIDNQGVSTYSKVRTTFSNGACVEDGIFEIKSFGNYVQV